MADDRSAAVLDAEGPGAPPRRNGELVFEAPWQSRLFGLTLSLQRAGLFEWEEFRERLIAEIRAWEASGRAGREWCYYERWRAAFEELLAAKGICAPAELAGRLRELAARDPEHP